MIRRLLSAALAALALFAALPATGQRLVDPPAAPAHAWGVNIDTLHASSAPASAFDGANGTFNIAAIYQTLDAADALGMTWLRVSAPWAPDTAALATPLVDRLNLFGINAAARGKTVIVDNGVPPLYNAALLMPDAQGNPQAYSTQTEAQLEALCHDAMELGPHYAGISKIRYWGLWNEGNLQTFIAMGQAPLFGGGQRASDFDLPIVHREAACMRGQARAIHENGQLVVLNFTDVNIGWPLELQALGVTFDAIAWHVYADSLYRMDQHIGQPAPISQPRFGIVAGQSVYDIPRILAGLGVPYILEEENAQERYAQTSTDPTDPTTLQGDMSLVNMMTQAARLDPAPLATILYRLTDQDDHPAPGERHFGLLRSFGHYKGAARAVLPFTRPGTVIGVP